MDEFHERRVAVLESTYTQLKEGLCMVGGKLDLILEQNTKVAILAEKSASHQLDLDRAALRIIELNAKHDKLSEQVTKFISFIEGLTKLAYALWTSLGAVVFLILIKMLFFLSSEGMKL